MKKKDLAFALGISGAMVSKLSARGMPTDTLEGALDWRQRHLDPGRVKDVVSGGPGGAPMSVITAQRMGELAEKDFATWADDYQAALRSVPVHHRAKVLLPLPLMRRLIKPAMEVLKDDPEIEVEAALNSGMMDDDEAELMGAFWYSIAAGEFVVHEGKVVAVDRPAIDLIAAF